MIRESKARESNDFQGIGPRIFPGGVLRQAQAPNVARKDSIPLFNGSGCSIITIWPAFGMRVRLEVVIPS